MLGETCGQRVMASVSGFKCRSGSVGVSTVTPSLVMLHWRLCKKNSSFPSQSLFSGLLNDRAEPFIGNQWKTQGKKWRVQIWAHLALHPSKRRDLLILGCNITVKVNHSQRCTLSPKHFHANVLFVIRTQWIFHVLNKPIAQTCT